MENLANSIQQFVVQAIMAGVIFYAGRYLVNLLSTFAKNTMLKRDMDPALVNFLYSMMHWGLLAFVVIAALAQLGIQTASFVAIIGAAGLAVGLALQGSLANFAAGVLILIFRPFKSGDFIEAAGTAGIVEKIQIFNTELQTPDNKHVIIPNAAVTGGNITNYSTKDTRRVDLIMGVSYTDDIDKARNAIQDVLKADDRVLDDPAPVVAVHQLADSSVNFVVRPWVKTENYWPVYWDLTEAIKKRFDKDGISIPFPQRDVHLYQEK